MDDLLQEVEAVKQLIETQMMNAVQETDEDLHGKFLNHVSIWLAQRGTERQREAFLHVDVLADALENIKVLSPSNKEKLRPMLMRLHEVLSDHG